MTEVYIAWHAAGIAGALFTYALAPALLYCRVREKKPDERKWRLWLPASVVFAWVFLNVYRMAIELPVGYAMAAQEHYEGYDGVGGNVAVLLAGWIVPLLGCLLFALIYTLIDKRKRRQLNQP